MRTTVEMDRETATKLESIAKAKNLSIEALLKVYIPGLLADGMSAGSAEPAPERARPDMKTSTCGCAGSSAMRSRYSAVSESATPCSLLHSASVRAYRPAADKWRPIRMFVPSQASS